MEEQEIRDKWARLHSILSRAYWQPLGKYSDQAAPTAEEVAEVEAAMGEPITEMDEANFNRIHSALWAASDAELVANGYEPDTPPE